MQRAEARSGRQDTDRRRPRCSGRAPVASLHHRRAARRRVPCSRPCAFMCVITGTSAGLLADGDRLGHAGPRAEVRLRREAVVIGEVGPPRRARRRRRLIDFLGLREVGRLVVETGRHAPRAALEPVDDQRAHPLDRPRASARRSAAPTTCGPDAVEPDVGADVEREAAARSRRSAAARDRAGRRRPALRISVVTPCVSMFSAVDSASGDAWLWMLMKPGATKSPVTSISTSARLVRQIADPRDESVVDADVGLIAGGRRSRR